MKRVITGLIRGSVALALLHVSLIPHGLAQSQAPRPAEPPGLMANPGEEPLPPDEAFKLKVFFKGSQTLVAEFVPAKNHYLYKSKVSFALKNPGGVLIREVRLPSGETKHDRFFGTMEVYKKPFQAEIILDRTPKAKSFTLLAMYQGCNEKIGLCYPPTEKSFDLVLP